MLACVGHVRCLKYGKFDGLSVISVLCGADLIWEGA